MAVHTAEALEEEDASALKVKIAIRASFICNCLLAVLQLYAAFSSLSLSLFATAIDSVFDPFANLVLNRLHKKGLTADPKKWPQGGARFLTIGASPALRALSHRGQETDGDDASLAIMRQRCLRIPHGKRQPRALLPVALRSDRPADSPSLPCRRPSRS